MPPSLRKPAAPAPRYGHYEFTFFLSSCLHGKYHGSARRARHINDPSTNKRIILVFCFFLLQAYLNESITVPGPKRQTSDLNVKTGWYHARQDTLPHFLLKTKEEEKGGRVSPFAWYQPVLTFRSVVCRLGPGTVHIFVVSLNIETISLRGSRRTTVRSDSVIAKKIFHAHKFDLLL